MALLDLANIVFFLEIWCRISIPQSPQVTLYVPPHVVTRQIVMSLVGLLDLQNLGSVKDCCIEEIFQ